MVVADDVCEVWTGFPEHKPANLVVDGRCRYLDVCRSDLLAYSRKTTCSSNICFLITETPTSFSQICHLRRSLQVPLSPVLA